MQIVRTHQRNTNSPLFQTATNFKKSIQSDTKQIKKNNSSEPEGKSDWHLVSTHGRRETKEFDIERLSLLAV
jgi:hypothetical protein